MRHCQRHVPEAPVDEGRRHGDPTDGPDDRCAREADIRAGLRCAGPPAVAAEDLPAGGQ